VRCAVAAEVEAEVDDAAVGLGTQSPFRCGGNRVATRPVWPLRHVNYLIQKNYVSRVNEVGVTRRKTKLVTYRSRTVSTLSAGKVRRARSRSISRKSGPSASTKYSSECAVCHSMKSEMRCSPDVRMTRSRSG